MLFIQFLSAVGSASILALGNAVDTPPPPQRPISESDTCRANPQLFGCTPEAQIPTCERLPNLAGCQDQARQENTPSTARRECYAPLSPQEATLLRQRLAEIDSEERDLGQEQERFNAAEREAELAIATERARDRDDEQELDLEIRLRTLYTAELMLLAEAARRRGEPVHAVPAPSRDEYREELEVYDRAQIILMEVANDDDDAVLTRRQNSIREQIEAIEQIQTEQEEIVRARVAERLRARGLNPAWRDTILPRREEIAAEQVRIQNRLDGIGADCN